ncbi:MAG: prolyl oligopeptidase family serine peptidase [Candidatus Cloacimonetes bacterium]|nr:prolyl oligopeptidase family serine peptidase [Candidatus Cloacimonadota bacterium]
MAYHKCFSFLTIAFLFCVQSNLLALDSIESPRTGEVIEGLHSFKRFQVIDSLRRKITYYVSAPTKSTLPLVALVTGSGCVSHFRKKANGSIGGGYQNVLKGVVSGRAHVMVVEKPYVEFLDFNTSPGSAKNCSINFNESHTLENWSQALKASIEDAMALPFVNKSRVLLIGHSEGAISVSMVASMLPEITHVATLSGSGPSQLFDFVAMASSPEEVQHIYKTYEAIQEDPLSSIKFWRGHPFIRWSSFFSFSTIELLEKTRAKLYMVHGENDQAVPVSSFDALVVDLKRKKRPFSFLRIPEANHSLNKPKQSSPEGMRNVFKMISQWFLN